MVQGSGVFTLCMGTEVADRLEPPVTNANLFFAGTLLGLGTAKILGTRFAGRAPKPSTGTAPELEEA